MKEPSSAGNERKEPKVETESAPLRSQILLLKGAKGVWLLSDKKGAKIEAKSAPLREEIAERNEAS